MAQTQPYLAKLLLAVAQAVIYVSGLALVAALAAAEASTLRPVHLALERQGRATVAATALVALLTRHPAAGVVLEP
jgi:predicted PurR-regulated permease PerM